MASRVSSRKKATVNYNEDGKDIKSKTVSQTVGKIKEEAVVKEEITKANKLKEAFAKTPAPKRKAEDEKEKQSAPAPAPAKKRKTKAKEETMPPASRTAVSSIKQMYIGAHVSAAGGVNNAIPNALHIGANAFALFLKSQRKWSSPPLAPTARDLFISECKHHSYDAGKHALPHGSYLVNLAQKDADKAEQAYACFLDDLKRCEELGIGLYNFHPGSTGGGDRGEAIGRIAGMLNRAHRETKGVVTVLENMAGGGNVVGAEWEDLRDIIEGVEDKTRVGVCIDTCHAFAAGHDLRTPEAFASTFAAFDSIVGRKYLKAFHLNDSKAPLGSKRDLHANIGTGFLGLRAFHCVMNEEGFRGMPMVLETPIDSKGGEDTGVWAEEIKLLERLVGMDVEGEEFVTLENELWEKGEGERGRVQGQVDKKKEKDGKKGRKKKVESEESE